MSDVAAMRAFNRELATVVGATVDVKITDGTVYKGTLRGIDQNSLSIVMANVTVEATGEAIPKIFIYGTSIVSFAVAEEELSLEGLAKQLEKKFPPGGVAYFPETQIVIVMNKIRITADGVDGTGPLYDRVKETYDEWMEEHGLA